MGVKMPEVRARRAVLFEEIAADALVYSKEHKASYPGGPFRPVGSSARFGKVPLEDITPQTIKAYLDTRDDLTKTTITAYRGTISMIFSGGHPPTAKRKPTLHGWCAYTGRTTAGFDFITYPKRPSSAP